MPALPAPADLELFVRAAELGSLSQAARELDLQPASASASLKRLEARLGARLMLRSTRALRLTPEGERYIVHARRALAALAEGLDSVAGDRAGLRGELRISAPSDFGRALLRGWLDDFQSRHPEVRLSLALSDRLADFYREPVDLAVRYGEMRDSGLIARALLPSNRRVLVAAPTYVERMGAPATPDDIAGHACVAWMLSPVAGGARVHDRWRFTRGRESREMKIEPRCVSDDGALVRDWAVAGRGLAFKAWIDVADDLAAGRLLRLLPDWTGEPAPVQLLYANREHQSALMRAAIDWLIEQARPFEARARAAFAQA
ncbi:LysR family transcriptional regulator [Derxia gummosa]|uniref:LysR family transcriptional regulator n=1 Tax=Derxia gummosa DSM 723 TaxID=1121388 RepID=A0A8B6X8G4_9BURK|nr:LysR family transcriptional regulator [Derxia gummosa]